MMNANVDEMIVNEVAAKELKMATKNYAQADALLNEANIKRQKLLDFRKDYESRFDNELKAFIDEDKQRGFRSFFLRLDVVLMEQDDFIAQLKKDMQIKRQLMRECQKKCDALTQQAEAIYA